MGRRGRLRRDERGQMMLLAAFIFVIGLLAMSAMLARVPLLAKQVSRENDRPLLDQVSPILEGLNAALDGLDDGDLENGTAEFDAAVEGLLAHLRALAGAQGFVLEWTLACDNAGDPATTRAHISLTDGELWVEVRSRTFEMSACP